MAGMERFTQRARRVLSLAHQEAERLRQEKEKQEADQRLEQQKAADAARKQQELAARKEAERLEKERQEQARAEAQARRQQELAARKEAVQKVKNQARLEKERMARERATLAEQKVQAAVARKEAERQAREARARLAAEAKAAIRQEKARPAFPQWSKKRLALAGGITLLVLGLVGVIWSGVLISREVKTIREETQASPLDAAIPTAAVTTPSPTPEPTLAPEHPSAALLPPLEGLKGNELIWEGWTFESVQENDQLNLLAARALFTPPNDLVVEMFFDELPEMLDENFWDFGKTRWTIHLDIDNDINTGDTSDHTAVVGTDYMIFIFIGNATFESDVQQGPLNTDGLKLRHPNSYGNLSRYNKDTNGFSWVRGVLRDISPEKNIIKIQTTLSVINPDTRITISHNFQILDQEVSSFSFLELYPVKPTTVGESPNISELDGMEMVYVPAGEFIMGSEDGYDNEQPAHMVTLDAFWMDKTEVTNARYQRCVAAGTCTPPLRKDSAFHPGYYEGEKFKDFPVIYVDWEQAQAYCAWAAGGCPPKQNGKKPPAARITANIPGGTSRPARNS